MVDLKQHAKQRQAVMASLWLEGVDGVEEGSGTAGSELG